MKFNFKQQMLTAVITMSTAGVYYAQTVQDTVNRSRDIEEVILRGVTDIAKDRKTPVAVSTVKAAQIVERLGNQELPEILNTTPSVYATKSGGGFGDSNMSIRGFESRNIAVMVNGMPVNDMEGGTVYFSNWTGLSDVTSTLQVQRGLGSSKLAIASVGGTVNFLTRAADMRRGAVVRIGAGNDGYHKASFAYNTGKTDNGLSTSFLLSRAAGATYIENTDFEAYTYYFALGYQPSAKHNLQFMVTSAPQWHDQRSYAPTIANYIRFNPDNDGTPFRRYNSDFGYYTDADGRKVALSNKSNYYAKPVMMLNWDWSMNDRSSLSTVLYMSNGRGGGTGDIGRVGGKGINDAVFQDGTGHIDFDKVFAANAAVDVAAAKAGSTLVRRSSINSHNWYGILANFQHKFNDNWNWSIGTDDRYYYGYHYQVLSNLYGAAGYKDDKNANAVPKIVTQPYNYKSLSWNPFGGKVAPMEDRIGYSNDGEVLWYSGFTQLEYTQDALSAFIQGSVSNQAYQRIDEFVKDGSIVKGQEVHRKTGFKNLFGYNVKGGANYNLDSNNNIFANIGYYSKQPFMNAVYPSNQQILNPSLTNEKIFSAELGYGYRSAMLNANVNLYRTQWKDRWMRRGNLKFDIADPTSPTGTTQVNGYAEISGITQVHMGVEVDATFRPSRYVEFQGAFSLGDYRYKGNATGTTFDESNNPINAVGGTNTTTLYLDDVKVGGSGSNSIPQLTASLGATLKPVTDLSIYGTWRYTDKLYSAIDINTFSSQANQARGVLQLPSFNLFDLGASYRIRLNDKNQYFTLGANVYNLFNTTYIADGATTIYTKSAGDFKDSPTAGTAAQQYAAYEASLYKGIDPANRVYFGFGRTWSASLSFNF